MYSHSKKSQQKLRQTILCEKWFVLYIHTLKHTHTHNHTHTRTHKHTHTHHHKNTDTHTQKNVTYSRTNTHTLYVKQQQVEFLATNFKNFPPLLIAMWNPYLKYLFHSTDSFSLCESVETWKGEIEHLKRLAGSLSLWIGPIYILSIAKISTHFVL